jgi:hypothetical protein
MAATRSPRVRCERGQTTIEYAALVILVAVLIAALLALAGARPPGAGIARAVLGALVCAVDGDCGSAPESQLETAYGAEVARLVGENAPSIFFESDEFVSLPVDFRRCRSRSCADTIRPGSVHATQTGLAPVAFTHVVDCRDAASAERSGYDCAGARGRLYLQYWLYYPDSLTHGLGRLGGFHLDDWESLQVRIGPDGSVAARASSHHGYNGARGGLESVGSDTGLDPRPAWEPWSGGLHVASGSHAGTTAPEIGDSRAIRADDLVLIPAEPVAFANESAFAVSPPWRKEVWRLPESMGT